MLTATRPAARIVGPAAPAGHRARRYRPPIHARHLSDSALADVLTTPLGPQDLADPGELTVVVATADGTRLPPEAAAALGSIPCVVLGLGHDPAAPPEHVDLVVEAGVATIDDVLATAARNPIATATLALLLRGTAGRDLAAGLVAESAAYSTLQAGPEFARWRIATPVPDRPPDDRPPVHVERDDDRLLIVLDRPHVHNALDRAMRDALLEALTIARGDPAITTVELEGAGPSFCSGGDLTEFGTFDDPAHAHLARLTASIGRAIDAVADRTVARLHGHCAGSGIELPAFAGHVVAAPDTAIALPEVALGLVPGAGGTYSLPRRIGRHRTALLALSGATIDASTALAWGLVDAITD
jgi:enoyl-CoA hydratase/carnithine racemase